MIEKRWLILLCKKPGDKTPPPPGIDIYNFFNGPGGIRTYWRDVTQGVLDLSFVTTQEWLEVDFDLKDYPGEENKMREVFVEACKQAAKRYPLGETDGIVVFTHASLDLWGKPGIVVCHVASDHNDIAHEVGHGIGLQHSFGAPSPALLNLQHSPAGRSPYSFPPDQYYAGEYDDRSDIMSVNNVWSKDNRGPALCGFNLLAYTALLGPVRPENILTYTHGERNAAPRLAPLYDRDRADPNLVIMPIQHGSARYEYSFELRTQEGWDAGLPNAGVFVHERRPGGTIVRLYRDRSADPNFWPLGFSRKVFDPPLTQGEELRDPTRRLRVKVLELNLAERYAQIEIEVGADPFPLEQRIRAVNAWATENGFTGAFPNFHEAPYGPGWSYPAILLTSDAVEWRDIPAAELGNPVGFEARFRAMNDWAFQRGFRSAFPNFHQADHGQGTVYGALLVKKSHADWRDIPAQALKYPGSAEARFVKMNEYARSAGYLGAFPNFHEAKYGPVNGTILLQKEAADWRDIPAAELGNPQTPEARFRAVNDWAFQHGYRSAFPNFHQADYGHGTVYGTILIKKSAADWRDIPAAELGNPQTSEARFRAANDWAFQHGYRSAFPNFHQADYGHGTVYGTILIKKSSADWRDVIWKELGSPTAFDARFRAVNDWAHQRGYRSAFPNFHEADYGKVYGTILIRTGAGERRTFQSPNIGNPVGHEARFRALDTASNESGFRGAFPSFEDVDYGRGSVFGTILLRENAVEWRDIPAAELGNSQTPEARFRAVNDWAHRRGYRGAIPTFYEANYGHGTVYGALLVRREAADWRDLHAAELGYPQTPEARFRAVNDWAFQHGYVSAYPNFHEADYGPVNGTILLRKEAADWRDIPAAELGNPQTPEARFRVVNDWAFQHGYRSAFPNFHQADYGHGTVYGTILIKKSAADWRDIPAAELGNPQTSDARFRAVNDWAFQHGYRSAFPNFHQADYGHGTVYGTILIKKSSADWRDLHSKELGYPGTFKARFRAANDWAAAHGYRGAYPNFHKADYGKVYGTILIKPGFAEHRDVPLSGLVFR